MKMVINWGTVQKAAEIVAKQIIRHNGKKYEFNDLINEIIVFVCEEAETEKSRFRRYATGEQTDEKVNKLAFSLITEKKWLKEFGNKTVIEYNNTGAYKTYNKAEAEAAVKKVLVTGPETEKEHLLLDYLLHFLTDKQLRTLRMLYIEGLKPKAAANIEGIHRVSIFERKRLALEKIMQFDAPHWKRETPDDFAVAFNALNNSK